MNIQETINNLRTLTELDIQNHWFFLDQNLTQPPLIIDDNWKKGEVNEKRYLVWEKGNKIRWFAQKITIPKSLNQDYPLEGLSLRIALTWWAESAEIFVNGQLVCEGDLFDSSSRILLTENVVENQEFIVTLKLISPRHDIGGLMASKCLYENEFNQIDPSFIANELTILSQYVNNFYPENLVFLDQEVKKINWNLTNNQYLFHQELINLRNRLLFFHNYIKERQFYMLGHAHLDMAWLWTIEETYQVAQRTFNSVLNLQKNYPYLTFGHTTAYLYQWIETHNHTLFNQIKEAVNNNQWEILGGMWVEPDVNLISGESLVRQLLYGQKYFFKKFGKYNQVGWLPDTFGFPWQLPQILLQAEINYFVTGKLHWNDTNKFPHGCFWWQSPDGSRIFTMMSPPNLAGIMDTNPITMTNHSVEWEKQTGLKDIFWLPGVGDHGGGPTRDMLEVAKRYDLSPFFPQIKFTTAQTYLEKISNISPEELPIWNEDLYLELHRGCYTTHADQKFSNRYSERLLYQTELFSTISLILSKQNKNIDKVYSNNQDKITHNWQKVLLNQFHDILPGTSINPVFKEANQLWQEVIENTEKILEDALKTIVSYINFDKITDQNSQKLVIFNGLNWERSAIVALNLDNKNTDIIRVFDDQGQELITQLSYDGKLLFYAENIPSIGYKSYYLLSDKKPRELKNNLLPSQFILENQYVKVTINEKTGNLTSIYDKNYGLEVLKGEANELQLFTDKGQYWDAWNIDPNYQNYPLKSPELISISWLEKGSLRQVIRIKKIFNKSKFIQDYILNFDSPIITINNQINWQENYTLLKVNFPLNIESNFVTYEIACGSIEKTTKPKTKEEKAQWEICGHQWADLSNNNYGVSLLNNCKYGYDSKPNQLRLTLLRSPQWPDEECDRENHEFIYSLYPHQGNWQQANTVKKGYELNTPLQIVFVNQNNSQLPWLPPTHSFLQIKPNNLIIMAFKLAENNDNQYVLRGYESHGETAEFAWESSLNLTLDKRVNLLENNLDNQGKIIKSYQIFSYMFNTNKESY